MDASDADLLARHCPGLQYDSHETFFADSVAALVDAKPPPRGNTLCRANGTILAASVPGAGAQQLRLDLLGAQQYAGIGPARKDDFLDEVGHNYKLDAARLHADPAYANRIYGHVAHDPDGSRWLQYWFFSYYNDKAFLGFGLHEGDLEMIQLRLGPGDEPDVVTYAQHTGGERADWSEVSRYGEEGGPRPLVYVARGSHASYLRAGKHDGPVVPDYNDAGGPLVDPALDVISDAGPGWALWPGSWGSTRSTNPLEANSPRGPAAHSQWRKPSAFHAAADKFDEASYEQIDAIAAAAPPAPALSVSRAGDHATVGFKIPPAADRPDAKQLVVTVATPDHSLAPLTYRFDVTGNSGEVTLPTDLGSGEGYEVRASVASADGQASPVVREAVPDPSPREDPAGAGGGG